MGIYSFMIIGIVGTLGAGKGTVVEYLKKKGYTHYSVSGELKRQLDKQGKSADRKNLSAVADEIAKDYKGGILEVIHKKTQQANKANVVLESIHRESEVEYLRSVGAVILGVDVDKKIRYDRAVKRQEGEKDNVTYEEFLADIEREEMGKGEGTSNIRVVLEQADFVLNNDGTPEELHQKIDKVLEKLS